MIGKDASLAAHSSTVAKVRVTYPKDTPAGKVSVWPCVYVNQGSAPFSGTTFCGGRATSTVLAAGSPGGTPTPTGSVAPTASATPAPASSSTASPSASPSASAEAPSETPSATSGTTSGPSGANSQLARTGSSGMSTTAAAAGALVLAGGGVLGVVALRRRTRA